MRTAIIYACLFALLASGACAETIDVVLDDRAQMDYKLNVTLPASWDRNVDGLLLIVYWEKDGHIVATAETPWRGWTVDDRRVSIQTMEGDDLTYTHRKYGEMKLKKAKLYYDVERFK